jgi:hypothetical protein
MHLRFAAAFVLILATAACGGVTSPSDNIVETFSGTLEPKPSANSIRIHGFTTQASGEIEVEITELAPVTNIFLGTFFGRPQADGSCGFDAFQPPNEFSTLNRVSIAAPISKGNWCVGIYDPGTLTRTSTYTLTVSHP